MYIVDIIISEQFHLYFYIYVEFIVFQTLAKYGGIDVLVSNAAVNPTFGPILDVCLII